MYNDLNLEFRRNFNLFIEATNMNFFLDKMNKD